MGPYERWKYRLKTKDSARLAKQKLLSLLPFGSPIVVETHVLYSTG